VFEGRSFSQALSAHPEVFSKVYVNLVGASEKGGYLKTVLAKIVALDEKKQELREILVSALAYPVFLLVFALAVVVFVLVAVFPKFADLFATIRNQLPITTLFLMGLSDFLLHYWLPTLFAVVASVAGTLYVLRQPAIAAQVDRLKLTLPGARGLFAQLYLLQFMQVLSLSLSNGVTILETVIASREVVKNYLFQRFLARLETRVTEGSGIAAAFSEFTFIPTMVEQMVSTGEESGNLPAVARRLAEFYERDLVKRLKILSKLAEPALLVVMGGVVGVIVSSLILPIFKLSKALG
jgi:type II secretory pathway component PulF